MKDKLPPLFYFMELGEWDKANERLQRKPSEAKVWATLRSSSSTPSSSSSAPAQPTKRLALHHACFKLRSAGVVYENAKEDPFVLTCQFILKLIELYPDAARHRETRHGCLPLHLAAFASCAPREPSSHQEQIDSDHNFSPGSPINKPNAISRRIASDATAQTTETNLTNINAEEQYTGRRQQDQGSSSPPGKNPNVKVAMRRSHVAISQRREEWAVKVINALLDAYPKAIRVDSEGGRLPLHTACAGRSTPRVLSTLLTAYPSAARHRNKDGFLPLHLAAHWGVAHPNVAIILLKTYPDATVGRNRWERTPLEEALCMAGENGRPHQEALVRALRKHPTYWARPSADLFRQPGATSTLIDVDESLPSNESSTLEELPSIFQSNFILGQQSQVHPFHRDQNQMEFEELLQYQKWDAAIERLERNPVEAEHELKIMTRGGFLSSSGYHPIHYACERKTPVEVIRKLVETFPMGVLTRCMPGGALPLHAAATWGMSSDVVRELLAADPGTTKITDELGNLALHCACFSGASIEVVEALVKADPSSVLTRNHQGSQPIDITKRLRHDNRREVLQLLNLTKDRVVYNHRRHRSSGTLSDVSRRAAELNFLESRPEQPIEVTYKENEEEKEELVWI